jgi:hypothetical protein
MCQFVYSIWEFWIESMNYKIGRLLILMTLKFDYCRYLLKYFESFNLNIMQMTLSTILTLYSSAILAADT